jgi:SAM-dependent methyltransferase
LTHIYPPEFFDYIEAGSRRSANLVVPVLLNKLLPRSVLDVGCGRGNWLAEWHANGVKECHGIDGSYVEKKHLHFEAINFHPHELSKPVDLKRKFDLVQSLEVAEHLPKSASETFVDTLTRHGDIILFSAAVKGQGGEDHINEQPISFWKTLFEDRGYVAFDCLRYEIYSDLQIEPWYRYNPIIYIKDSAIITLSEEMLSTRVKAGVDVKDYSSLLWKLRLMVIRLLPQCLVNWLAVLNTRHIARIHLSPK